MGGRKWHSQSLMTGRRSTIACAKSRRNDLRSLAIARRATAYAGYASVSARPELSPAVRAKTPRICSPGFRSPEDDASGARGADTWRATGSQAKIPRQSALHDGEGVSCWLRAIFLGSDPTVD